MGLLGAGLLLTLSPAAVLAQGSATLVLYEWIESPPLRPITGGLPGIFIPGPDGSMTRLAQAALSGTATTATDPLAKWVGANIGAHAQSQVDLTTGSGPISGVFTVLRVTAGNVSGTIDLSGLLTGASPNAPVEGVWGTVGRSALSGSFSGLAQVPIQCGDTACYLNPDWTTEPAVFNSAGIPLVRFVLTVWTY